MCQLHGYTSLGPTLHCHKHGSCHLRAAAVCKGHRRPRAAAMCIRKEPRMFGAPALSGNLSLVGNFQLLETGLIKLFEHM